MLRNDILGTGLPARLDAPPFRRPSAPPCSANPSPKRLLYDMGLLAGKPLGLPDPVSGVQVWARPDPYG